jgi:pimeloyl-ACP methyl ester carboxylesterase
LTERTVESSDGTTIGWIERGRGPTLLLVHGSRTDASDFDKVTELLCDRYRVAAMDRRGRGRSGDGARYDLDLEADDVVAVARALAAPVVVFGHSMGGHIVLRAAARPPGFAGVMVYEPSIPGMVPPIGPPRHEALAMCRDDDPETALVALLTGVMGMLPEAVERLRRRQSWGRRVALFPTYVRELDALEELRADPAWCGAITGPVRVLMGGDTNRARWDETEAVAASIPQATVHALEGQRHEALRDAPDLVAAAIDQFVAECPDLLNP